MVCIDGVEYIVVNASNRSAMMAPHYGVDGTIYLCKPEQPDPLEEVTL